MLNWIKYKVKIDLKEKQQIKMQNQFLKSIPQNYKLILLSNTNKCVACVFFFPTENQGKCKKDHQLVIN